MNTNTDLSVFQTIDSGKHWSPVDIPGTRDFVPSDVECVYPRTCWLPGYFTTHKPSLTGLMRSEDSGKRWSLLTHHAPPFVDTLSCLNEDVCNATTNVGNINYFSTSKDGARNWTTVGRIDLAAFRIYCVNRYDCLAIGISALATTNAAWTTDAGKNWTYFSAPLGADFNASIACALNNICLIGGSQLSIWNYNTRNDSGSFRSAGFPFGSIEVSCPSSNSCLAVTANASGAVIVRRETDLGRTWRNLAVTSLDGPVSGLSCPTRTTCYMAGSGPSLRQSIYISRDGGMTWRPAA